MKLLLGIALSAMTVCVAATAATTSTKVYTATRMYPAAACSAATAAATRDSKTWLSQGWTVVSQSPCDCQNAALEMRCTVEVTYWRP